MLHVVRRLLDADYTQSYTSGLLLASDTFISYVMAECQGIKDAPWRHRVNKAVSRWSPEENIRNNKKIADCLSSLDELIELQAKKLEALKAHKKGLMQQLFPPARAKPPLACASPSSANAGPWEVKRVGGAIF